MKICIISNLYEPYELGGAEINARRLAESLSKNKELCVITTEPFSNLRSFLPSKQIIHRVPIYRFYPFNFYNTYFTKKRKMPAFLKICWHIIDVWNTHVFLMVLWILRCEKPDVIHTHNIVGFSCSVLWAAKFLRIPVVHTLHDYHLLCPYANFVCPVTSFAICKQRTLPCRIYSLLKKILFNDIPSFVIGPSQWIIDIHKKFGFFKKIPSKVVHYFVNNQRQQPIKNRKTDVVNILYLGRLSREKGVDILIRAFREVANDAALLHIVGDGSEQAKLQKLAGAEDRIIFYGRVAPDETGRFYQMADWLVIPSVWYDNFPTVVLEAFSFGVPVIGSRLGGISEQIQDGYNGFLFSHGDLEELKLILHRIIEDQKNSNNCFNHFKKNALWSAKSYNEEEIVGLMVGVYGKVI